MCDILRVVRYTKYIRLYRRPYCCTTFRAVILSKFLFLAHFPLFLAKTKAEKRRKCPNKSGKLTEGKKTETLPWHSSLRSPPPILRKTRQTKNDVEILTGENRER